MPWSFQLFLHSRIREAALEFKHMRARNAIHFLEWMSDTSRGCVPVATLLITGGLLGYAISPRTANSAAAGLVNVANTAAVTCPLVPGLGTCEITGDFAVRAGWTKNLTAEFDSYDSANPKLHFAGRILTTNRTIQVAGYSTRKIDSPQSGRFNETENQRAWEAPSSPTMAAAKSCNHVSKNGMFNPH
jgi:hypothetical protein